MEALTKTHLAQVFGVIRHMAPFRLTGGSQDYILIASDSGKIALLQYKKEKNAFHRIHLETFGKSGCRRIVPGQFLAVDPKGRACLIGESLGRTLLPAYFPLAAEDLPKK